MDNQEVGRVVSDDQALVNQASAGLGRSGFDPSRWRAGSYDGKPRHMPKKEAAELRKLVDAAREYIDGLTYYRRSLLAKAARSVSPINCSWQQYALAEAFVYELHSDSDGSGEASETRSENVNDE